VAKQTARTRQAQYHTTFSASSWLIGDGLAVVTLSIYAQVIWHQFIALDDDLYSDFRWEFESVPFFLEFFNLITDYAQPRRI
jgi:hypothetical protein